MKISFTTSKKISKSIRFHAYLNSLSSIIYIKGSLNYSAGSGNEVSSYSWFFNFTFDNNETKQELSWKRHRQFHHNKIIKSDFFPSLILSQNCKVNLKQRVEIFVKTVQKNHEDFWFWKSNTVLAGIFI